MVFVSDNAALYSAAVVKMLRNLTACLPAHNLGKKSLFNAKKKYVHGHTFVTINCCIEIHIEN